MKTPKNVREALQAQFRFRGEICEQSFIGPNKIRRKGLACLGREGAKNLWVRYSATYTFDKLTVERKKRRNPGRYTGRTLPNPLQFPSEK